jgi:hypothetical protein
MIEKTKEIVTRKGDVNMGCLRKDDFSGKEDGKNGRKEEVQDYRKEESSSRERDAAMLMNAMTIFGGPAVGFNTNPATQKRPCFIEISGEKIVCVAQGGECRYNYKFYSPGLNDRKSWTTPIIDEDCPDRCCYKVIVCDNHDEKCEGSVTYYPQYNKFRGQFKRYCRNFDKYVNKK